ncbi:hypothetical protein GCM10010401_14020 [Rarobacter faecitabidus]|uniref:Uncharacterized protein n=1 Tax=Rarobacter faecitabidus TaxID=13243 RepID=A0A542ZDY2_RARFA|nr:hypothetical protein FB461_1968 [Rarobacter faecitabidus]
MSRQVRVAAQFPGDGNLHVIPEDGRLIATCIGCAWERLAETDSAAREVQRDHMKGCPDAKSVVARKQD